MRKGQMTMEENTLSIHASPPTKISRVKFVAKVLKLLCIFAVWSN